jgi:periplasmic divalent cation tolerance protein
VVVLTTVGVDGDPASIARTLVTERLAACVNVLPEMISVYRWKGSVEQDREQQLVIKTSEASLAALESRLGELHPYEVPEFLVLRVSGGAERYLAWMKETTEPI